MLNWAKSDDLDEARDLKALGKNVLAALVEAIEAAGFAAPPVSAEATYRGRPLAWRLAAEVAPPCPECGCDRLAYEPEGEGLRLEFCPACWSLRGSDPAGAVSFDVTAGLAKKLRDLPPGTTAKLKLRGQEIGPLTPPPPATDAERTAAMEAWAASAVRGLEIGRQVWMGRLTFEGTKGVRQDYAEARRWFERAAAWGSGEALTTLGVMALQGLGEPADAERALALCRNGAERGSPGALAGMGRFFWDGTGVPQDREAAVAWWGRAARKGDKEARRLLVQASELGLEGARTLVAELGLEAAEPQG